MADRLPKEMSQAAYARHIGKSRQYVAKLIKLGKLGLNANKKINVKAADKALALADPDAIGDGIPRAGGEGGQADALGGMNLAEAKVQREYYKAQLEKLKYEKEIGKLVEADGMQKALTDFGRLMAQRITGWPARLAPMLAVETDPIKIEAVMKRETGALIDELRTATGRLLSGDQGLSGGSGTAA